MREKTLIIEEYEEKRQEKFRQILSRMVRDEQVNLTVRLVYHRVEITRKILDSIADTIKSVGKEREFMIEVILETDQWKRLKRLYKVLNQYGITVELCGSDSINIMQLKKYKRKMLLERVILHSESYEDFHSQYEKWKIAEIPIQLKGYTLSSTEYREFFEEWVYDAHAVWFFPFEDTISSILTGVTTESCEHNSCMGKYIHLDEKDRVSFCKKGLEPTKLYVLDETKEGPLFEHEIYQNVLGDAIEKRARCQKECQMFGLCRGGCPLESADTSTCNAYIEKIAYTGRFLEQEGKTAFVHVENPCLRQLCLSLLAYGFDFTGEETQV